jgi:phosphohistidine phosphatase
VQGRTPSEDFELYLIRHGLAAERGENYPDDTKRPLTQRGIERLKREGRGLAVLDVAFDLILTSPLVRARQTAEAIADAFRARPQIVTTDALVPGGAHSAIIDELAKHSRRKRIALVGHEPGIGELAARLIGVRRPLEFKKGAVCRIDVPALPPTGPGQLRWLVTPRILRKLGSK